MRHKITLWIVCKKAAA